MQDMLKTLALFVVITRGRNENRPTNALALFLEAWSEYSILYSTNNGIKRGFRRRNNIDYIPHTLYFI